MRPNREVLFSGLILFGICSDITFMLHLCVFGFMFVGGESRMERDAGYLNLINTVGCAWVLGLFLFVFLYRSMRKTSDDSEWRVIDRYEQLLIFYCTLVVYWIAGLVTMCILSLNITLGG